MAPDQTAPTATPAAPTRVTTAARGRPGGRPVRRPRRRPAPVVFDVADLSVYYGSFRAVRDASLQIHQHEITAFIGPSGCGKSTMLRCFNRMNDLIEGCRVEGTLRYHGIDLYDAKIDPVEVRKRIGMVFQKPNPFPKSIYDNIAFGPKLAGHQGQHGRHRRVGPAQGRPVGRGQGPAQEVGAWACPAASSSGSASPAPSRSSPRSC